METTHWEQKGIWLKRISFILGIIAIGTLMVGVFAGLFKLYWTISDSIHNYNIGLILIITFSIFLLVSGSYLRNGVIAGFCGVAGFLLGNWGIILSVVSGLPDWIRKSFFDNEDMIFRSIRVNVN